MSGDNPAASKKKSVDAEDSFRQAFENGEADNIKNLYKAVVDNEPDSQIIIEDTIRRGFLTDQYNVLKTVFDVHSTIQSSKTVETVLDNIEAIHKKNVDFFETIKNDVVLNPGKEIKTAISFSMHPEVIKYYEQLIDNNKTGPSVKFAVMCQALDHNYLDLVKRYFDNEPNYRDYRHLTKRAIRNNEFNGASLIARQCGYDLTELVFETAKNRHGDVMNLVQYDRHFNVNWNKIGEALYKNALHVSEPGRYLNIVHNRLDVDAKKAADLFKQAQKKKGQKQTKKQNSEYITAWFRENAPETYAALSL